MKKNAYALYAIGTLIIGSSAFCAAQHTPRRSQRNRLTRVNGDGTRAPQQEEKTPESRTGQGTRNLRNTQRKLF